MLYGDSRPENIHRATLFHGPAYQAVTGIRRVGSNGLEADMTVLPVTPFIADQHRTLFQTDPAMLDAASHLIGYWVAERFAVDLSFFPFACREYRQYAPWPAAHSRILCQASIRLATPVGDGGAFELLGKNGDVLMRLDGASATPEMPLPDYETCRLVPPSAWIEANFRFYDSDGRLLAQLEGWSDRYFSISHRFYRCRLWPASEFFSEPHPAPRSAASVRCINRRLEEYLDQGWGIWKRALAHLMLSRRERALWYGLPEQADRRTEWLLGRIAAKDAVREWARGRYGVELVPAEVEILPDENGRPVVECAGLRAQGAAPEVSISHDATAVVGIAGEPGTRLGIDHCGLAEQRAYDMLEIGLTPAELAMLPASSAADRQREMLLFWCAKEAAAKTTGNGLKGDPRKWVIASRDCGSGRLTVVHDGVAFPVETWLTDDGIIAVCEQPRSAA